MISVDQAQLLSNIYAGEIRPDWMLLPDYLYYGIHLRAGLCRCYCSTIHLFGLRKKSYSLLVLSGYKTKCTDYHNKSCIKLLLVGPLHFIVEPACTGSRHRVD